MATEEDSTTCDVCGKPNRTHVGPCRPNEGPPPNVMQALVDAGVNAFGALLFAESIAGNELVASRSAAKPVVFVLPVRQNKGQTKWAAVRITLEAIPNDAAEKGG